MRLIWIAWICAAACAHARRQDPHPCDGYVEIKFEPAPARANDPAQEASQDCSHEKSPTAAQRERATDEIRRAQALVDVGECDRGSEVALDAFHASGDPAALELAASAARCANRRVAEHRLLQCLADTPGADAARTAAALRDAEQATAALVVRCPEGQGFDFSIDDDRMPTSRCGQLVRLSPGSHRVIVPGQPYYELVLQPGERVVLATTRREHGC